MLLFEKKIGVWGELTTVTKKSTNFTYVYSDVESWWHSNTTPETVITVDFKDFINRFSNINNKRELSAFLANISKETTGGWELPVGGGSAGDYAQWGLYFVHELGYTPANSAGAYSQAHSEFPPNPTKGYYGRGPIQLSWNYNYGQFSKFLFNDKNVLLNNPDTIQKDGVLAFKSAIWFWMMPQCPKPSCHQVMHDLWMPTTGDYSANKMYLKGFAHTNNIINGGLECRTSSTNAFTIKVALRSELYKYYLGILGFNNSQISAENTGNYSTLCYESNSNAMENYLNCAVLICTPTSSNKSITICANQTYTFNNQTISVAGIYKDTLMNFKGCDSVETLTLNVNLIKNTFLSKSICHGDSFLFNKAFLKVSGAFKDSLKSYLNCDSIVNLNLTVNDFDSVIYNVSICQGDSFFFNNQFYRTTGKYQERHTNIFACDSIVSLNLTVNEFDSVIYNVSICQGDSFFFNNQFYRTTGKYQERLKNIFACDSILFLNLNVNPLPIVGLIQNNNQLIASPGYLSYRWFLNSNLLDSFNNVFIANKSGQYSVEVKDSNGCINLESINHVFIPLNIGSKFGQQLQLYPVPSKGVLYLQNQELPVLIRVYDIYGSKLIETIVETSIDLSLLSNGFYWIEVGNIRRKIFLNKH